MLETQSCNTNAIGFYLHEGFTLIGFDACCYANNDLERFLVSEGAEPVVPGLLDFFMYTVYANVIDYQLYGLHPLKYRVFLKLFDFFNQKKDDLIAIIEEQGIFDLYPEEKKRWYVKVPVFSFNKLRGLDAYLSPEMKSTGEAIGYDDKLNRALYKALQAAGMHLQNYGTVFATIADKDKEEALPLIRRFYNLGFNIEATHGTANFLKSNGIRTHALTKLSEGSEEIPEALRQGHIAYFINTKDPGSNSENDGTKLRQIATEYNVTMFTSLDTVKALLDVLEETTLTISTIDA